MKVTNQWVQCINCGNEYSVETILCKKKQVDCPDCNSEEYIVVEQNNDYSGGEFIELNESLMEDGEWD